MEPVTIADVGRIELINVVPGSNPPRSSRVSLRIDPEAREATLETESGDDGTPIDEYHGRALRHWVWVDGGGAVDGPATVAWLRGAEMQSLLGAVCDGHSVEWDGSNNVGTLDESGKAAFDRLEERLSAAPESDWVLYMAEDWLDYDSTACITAKTTDIELDTLEALLESEAMHDKVRLHGLDRYLERVRQSARDIEAESAE